MQSIAARVMAGIGEPGLILPPGASPHGYALRPSEARLLQDADLVVWVGPALTPWLADPIDALAPGATLRRPSQDAPGVETLPIRAGGPFEADEHADGGQHDHEQPRHAAPAEAHRRATSGSIPTTPSPRRGRSPRPSPRPTRRTPPPTPPTPKPSPPRPTALPQTIEARVAPLRGRPFIVFHDAYQYFEHRFDLPAAGSIALHDGVAPGAARVADIRDRVLDDGVVCAFAEPEFEPALLGTVIEGTAARTGRLDGIGAGLPPGPGPLPRAARLPRRRAGGLPRAVSRAIA